VRSLRRRAVPSPSIVVGIIALVIALGGTAFAQSVLPRNSVGSRQIRTNAVTSSEIKDRTIRLRDISRTARSELRGQRGPAGPPGPPGAAGTGTGTGSAALNLVVATAAGSVGAGAVTAANATCPAGRRVTGGGARVDTGTDVSVRESYPSSNNTVWTVRVGNDDAAGTATYTAFAICAA
jgi:hypothetical protein